MGADFVESRLLGPWPLRECMVLVEDGAGVGMLDLGLVFELRIELEGV